MSDQEQVFEAELVTRNAKGEKASRHFEYRARSADTPEKAVDELANSFTADTDRRITPVSDGD